MASSTNRIVAPSGDLAINSRTSEQLIRVIENGGQCLRPEADLLASALGVSLVTLGAIDLG
jgi:hypothetical protein